MADAQQCFSRPPGRKAPDVPYHNPSASNPILRGWSLAAASTIISRSSMIQGVLWGMNGFDKLKDLPALKDYYPRHDPTVAAASSDGEVLASVKDLAAPQGRKDDGAFYTSADFVALYTSGKLTPVDVAEYLLPLIRRDTKPPGKYSVGWISVRPDLILEAAKASAERYRDGRPLSPLDGVPIAIKDSCDITGYKQSQGSPADHTGPGDKTAWAVSQWQKAGAIILGKTTMHEIGLDTTSVNLTYGTPRNPHNPAYYTGGSSGGSSYALASGIVPIALGFDGGGSNRIPACLCGMYGLKPTHGRVSSRAGNEIWDSVAVCGPLASSIDDLALAYRTMAAPDPDSRSSKAFPPTLIASPVSSSHPKRIGIMRQWIERSDANVIAAFDRAVAHLTKANYEIIDITIPLLPEGQKAHALTIVNETRASLSRNQLASLNYHNQLLISTMTGRATAQDFIAAQRLRSLLMEHLAYLWDQYPGLLVLTPTTTIAGWKIANEADLSGAGAFDGDTSLRSMEYVYLANFIGAPAISVPMGYTEEENLPMGLMAMAEWCKEEQLFGFARDAEGVLGSEGVRRPKPEGSWVDALEFAEVS